MTLSRPSHLRDNCPDCARMSGTLTLLTSMMRYFVCECCGCSWQMPRSERSFADAAATEEILCRRRDMR